MTAPHPAGAGAALALARALADAGLGGRGRLRQRPRHGHAAQRRRRVGGLQAALGPRAAEVPLTATKGVVGHLLGSSGAIEAVATVLCLREREVHPTPGGGRVDPAFGAGLVLDAPQAVPDARAALSTSLAFGGSNAALVLGRWDDVAVAAVTGLGVVGSFGCGVGALAEALRTSRAPALEVDRSAGYHLPRGRAHGGAGRRRRPRGLARRRHRPAA